MPLDVSKIDGRGDTGILEQFAGVIPQVVIVDEPPQITFEVPGIDRVEPHQRRKEAPIRFGHPVAAEVSAFRKALLQPVEGREERAHCPLIGVLRRRKTSLVDAIVDGRVDARIEGVYKAGFATTQDAYEGAVRPLFATLDWLEERLAKSRSSAATG